MRALLASTGQAFVGEVTALASERNVEIGSGSFADESDGPIKRAPGRQASVPISQFTVTVVRSLAGDLIAGQSVVLEQPGGVITRADGSQAQVVLGGDEPIQTGQTYLFFASSRADRVLTSSPFGRFAVQDDGSLAAPSHFSEVPVARQLAGLSVDEAASEVQNAH